MTPLIEHHLATCSQCQANLSDHKTMQQRIQHSLQVNLRAARPSPQMTFTLQWQAQHKMTNDYIVFVHLLDASGHLAANGDAPPANGTRPTTEWIPGERVTDPHVLVLPENLTPGDYHIAVGLYDSNTSVRLANPVLLGQPITIVP